MQRRHLFLLAAPPALAAAPRPAPQDLSDFGIAGDGRTDDGPAIQKAVDSGLGELHLWRGRFRVAKPIVINLDRTGPTSISGAGVATVIMAGAGPAFRFVGSHAGTAAPASVKPNVWERQRAPMVDGLEVVGDHPEADGVQLEGLMKPTLTRMVIRRARHGIRLTGRNRNVIVSDSHIYENSGVGILLEDVNLHQINIVGSHVSYNKGGGIVIRRTEVRNIQIGTCDIEANQDPKGPPAANVLFDAREGSILEGAIAGCTIQHGHEAAGSANVRFLGRGLGRPQQSRQLHHRQQRPERRVREHPPAARPWRGGEREHVLEGPHPSHAGGRELEHHGGPEQPGPQPRLQGRRQPRRRGLHRYLGQHDGRPAREPRGPPGPALILRRCRRFQLANVTVLDAGGKDLMLDSVSDVKIRGGNLEPTSGQGGR